MALSFGYDIGTADSSFIYGQKELKHLDKQYLRSINPEKHMENITKHREYDQKRDQTEERKRMHQAIDAKRNQTPKRKKMFSDYEQTETQRLYKKKKI